MCPICNAPHNYLYDNNGGRGQYLCKICNNTFNPNNYHLSVEIKRPHCNKTLIPTKERKDFIVYKCKNNNCSFYKNKLVKMSNKERKKFKNDPQAFKVKYIYNSTLILFHLIKIVL